MDTGSDNKESLKVMEIIEDDFGCDGIPDDVEAEVTVIVTDCRGNEQKIRMSDSLAYERKIENGCIVILEKDGTLNLAN